MMVVSERIQLLSSWTHVLTADLRGFVFCTLCTRIIFLCVGFFKDIFVPLGQGAVRKTSEGKNDDVKVPGGRHHGGCRAASNLIKNLSSLACYVLIFLTVLEPAFTTIRSSSRHQTQGLVTKTRVL